MMLFLSCCGVAGPCAGKGCLPSLRTGWGMPQARCRAPAGTAGLHPPAVATFFWPSATRPRGVC